MAILNEARRPGCYMIADQNHNISRRTLTFVGTGVPGQVLGHDGTTYVPFNQDGIDGSEEAQAILWDYADSVTAIDAVMTVRGPVDVNGWDLVWPDDITDNEKAAAEAALLTASDIRVWY
jgi:Bacteriophage lambda head decoration protein D